MMMKRIGHICSEANPMAQFLMTDSPTPGTSERPATIGNTAQRTTNMMVNRLGRSSPIIRPVAPMAVRDCVDVRALT